MKDSVQSVNDVRIRLTEERWMHIVEEHYELAGMRETVLEVVGRPHLVLSGNHGELLAIREIHKGKFLVVPYREIESDGFIITAFLTKRYGFIKRRKQIWPGQQ